MEKNLEIKNFTHEIVVRRLNELLDKRDNICKCDVCTLDMVAYALSRLPSRTYVSKEGAIYRELEALNDGFKLEVVEKCLLAISKVSKNPRHKIENSNSKGELNSYGTTKTHIRTGKKEQLYCH